MKHLKIFTVSLALFLWSASSAVLAQPALWLIEDGDTQIHLFGTIHVGSDKLQWLDDDLKNKIQNADVIYLELSREDLSPEATLPFVQQYGLLAAGTTIDQRLSAETYEKLQNELLTYGMPPNAFDQMRPWLGAITLTVLKAQSMGMDPEQGVEKKILSLIHANTPVRGLESIEDQLGIFGDLSPEIEEQYLQQTLAEVEQLEDMLDGITTAWIKGDLSKLEKLVNGNMSNYPDMADKFLYQRNRNWIHPLKDILNKPGSFFVAVGAGHLLGEQGVPELLRKEGIQVKRLP